MLLYSKKLFENFGLHSFLLPVFFVLHTYIQYYGMASSSAALEILLFIEIVFLCFFLLFLLIIRNPNKSLLVTTLSGFIFLFYGVIKDFFSDTIHAHFLAKYIVLLPLLILAEIGIIRFIFKKNDFSRINLFLNLLLIIYLLFDGISLIQHSTQSYRQGNLLVNKNILEIANLPAPAERPDIYFLVFDSYPGTDFLKQYVQYNNSLFNDSLKNKGFYIVADPNSNYNRTAFSISSTLNFEYLNNIQENTSIEPKLYNMASLTINYAVVPDVFKKNGYKIYNLSFFDLGDQHPIMKENFLVLPDKQMLLYNILSERIKREILWNFTTGRFGLKIFEKLADVNQENAVENNFKKRDFNNKAIDSLLQIATFSKGKSKFIYAHFYLPHPPFFYDSNGIKIDLDFDKIIKAMEDKPSFISYLKYTNNTILKIVDTILNHNKQSVIILQSDHGYRDFRQDKVKPYLYFKNYSAFYFPDHNYSMLYDNMSNINTFPVIFNKYFKTNIALHKDSTFFLPY
jgi:Sulfatase